MTLLSCLNSLLALLMLLLLMLLLLVLLLLLMLLLLLLPLIFVLILLLLVLLQTLVVLQPVWITIQLYKNKKSSSSNYSHNSSVAVSNTFGHDSWRLGNDHQTVANASKGNND